MNTHQTFRAYRIHEENRKVVARFEDLSLADLSPGEVVIRVSHSDINYKDALAATGSGRILRRYPLVAGIDLAGEVVSSVDARFKPGDEVVVTGSGLSESHDGGYAEFARVRAEWVIPLPAGLSLADSMRLGTAGFTAARFSSSFFFVSVIASAAFFTRSFKVVTSAAVAVTTVPKCAKSSAASPEARSSDCAFNSASISFFASAPGVSDTDSRFQIFTSPKLPLARRVPSGLNASASVMSRCASSWPICLRVARS